jgi:hypothetical protein
MPTVLVLNGLRVVIYPVDHRPAHVHVQGAGFEIVFDLNCPDGPLDVRDIKGKVSDASVRRAAKLIAPSLSTLCGAWRNIHGNYH